MATSKKDRKVIMVADDDEDLLFLLDSQLKKAGFNVHLCIGGKGLVSDVLRVQPNLLLLDIAMQQVDGSELCKEIRKDFRISQIKILLMSGNHNVDEHAKLCGANGFIAKPLSFISLMSEVSKYI